MPLVTSSRRGAAHWSKMSKAMVELLSGERRSDTITWVWMGTHNDFDNLFG
jgi:hypothetical protein